MKENEIQKNKKITITVRVDKELHEKLNKFAEKEDRSIGSIIRKILMKFFDKK